MLLCSSDGSTSKIISPPEAIVEISKSLTEYNAKLPEIPGSPSFQPELKAVSPPNFPKSLYKLNSAVEEGPVLLL